MHVMALVGSCNNNETKIGNISGPKERLECVVWERDSALPCK